MAATWLPAQDDLVGTYRDYWGSKLELNQDSTFYYAWGRCLMGSWSIGTWRVNHDTVIFRLVPIMDTLGFYDLPRYTGNLQGPRIPKLVLSVDQEGELLTQKEYEFLKSGTGGQNYYAMPEKLFIRRNRLYPIDEEGALKRGKAEAGLGRKYPFYYRKIEP